MYLQEDVFKRLRPGFLEGVHILVQHQQAILDFDATIDRNPFVAAPYAARGQSFVTTGQYDKAIEDFNAALNVNANDADSWAWRGVAYEKLGNKSAAAESFQRALSLDSGNAVARKGQSGGGIFRS